MTTNILYIYTDGGARGNPGPAACAFVLIENGKVTHKESKYLGIKTNNEAEYNAVIEALKWIMKDKYQQRVIFYIDSELVVNQLNGIYKSKSLNLKPLINEIKILERLIGNQINYVSIRREKNKLADSLVNQKLDMMKHFNYEDEN